MKIALLNNVTLYWLAGETGVAQSLHSSARDFTQTGQIIIDNQGRVRAPAMAFRDRLNLKTDISFGTTRKFATTAAAETWVAIYDAVMPRTGYLQLYTESGDIICRLDNAVVSPPARSINGVSVDLKYTVVGGQILVPDGAGSFETPEISMGGQVVTME